MNKKVLEKYKNIKEVLDVHIQKMESDSEYVPNLILDWAEGTDLRAIVKYTLLSKKLGSENFFEIFLSDIELKDDEIDKELLKLVVDFMTNDEYNHKTTYLQRIVDFINKN